MPTFIMILLMFASILLILVILLQRGRGGGLVGALSGLGGQSAFGTKAGDMFTRITIGIAAVWVLLAGIAGGVLRSYTVKFKGNEPAEIRSLTKEAGAGASSTIDDSKDNEVDLKEPDAKGTDSKDSTKSEGDPAAKRAEEATPGGDTSTPEKNPESGEKPGESK